MKDGNIIAACQLEMHFTTQWIYLGANMFLLNNRNKHISEFYHRNPCVEKMDGLYLFHNIMKNLSLFITKLVILLHSQ